MLGAQARFTGDIPHIINNAAGLYEGDLRYYAKIIFGAPNIYYGYHGLRHMLHVTWVCYRAIDYYTRLGQMTPRRARNLLVAALFHDYAHAGKPGDDTHNIARAVVGLSAHLLPEDRLSQSDIETIMWATLFPHRDLGPDAVLEQLIIRDADMSQALGPAWIGDMVAGLGSEQGRSPCEMLEQQLVFLSGVHFHTDFGLVEYGDEAVRAKIAETRALLDFLG